jgi:hypothetical protein
MMFVVPLDEPDSRRVAFIDCVIQSASHLAMRGVPARTIQELAGHEV